MNNFNCSRCGTKLDDNSALFFEGSDDPYCEECFKYEEDRADSLANDQDYWADMQQDQQENEATGN
jgi:hypothetical protein